MPPQIQMNGGKDKGTYWNPSEMTRLMKENNFIWNDIPADMPGWFIIKIHLWVNQLKNSKVDLVTEEVFSTMIYCVYPDWNWHVDYEFSHQVIQWRMELFIVQWILANQVWRRHVWFGRSCVVSTAFNDTCLSSSGGCSPKTIIININITIIIWRRFS